MKKCSKCKQELPEEAFNWRNKSQGKRQDSCRECKKVIQRAYYQNNRQSYVAKITETKKTRIAANKRYARDILSSGCVDCGFLDIRALEFDHLGESTKVDGVMAMINDGASLDRIKTEISKCEVVCRNCHSIRTITRLDIEPYWSNSSSAPSQGAGLGA